MSKPKTTSKIPRTLIRRDDSELVMQVGPFAIFRGSNLIFDDKGSNQGPTVQPYYTLAIGKQWLDEGGEVELCIDGNVRIAGTHKVLDEEEDLIVQVGGAKGKYSVLVMDSDGAMSSHLELESVNVIDFDRFGRIENNKP
jgi:hypothetical protein